MNALEIINFAFDAGIILRTSDNQLIVDAPKGEITEEFKICLSKYKQEIIDTMNYHNLTKEELKQYAQYEGRYTS